jgi:hypothetical protein
MEAELRAMKSRHQQSTAPARKQERLPQGLDQAVVEQARAAGIGMDEINMVSELFNKRPGNLKDEKRTQGMKKRTVLDESGGEEQDEAPAQANSEEDEMDWQGMSPSERCLATMAKGVTKAVTLLAESQSGRKSTGGSLEATLSGMVSGSSGDHSSGTGGLGNKRGVYLLQELARSAVANPKGLRRLMQLRMLADEEGEDVHLYASRFTDQEDLPTPKVNRWLETRSRIGTHRQNIMMASAIAPALQASMEGRTEECTLRLLLAMSCFEQVGIDKGSWDYAWHLLLQKDPPYEAIAARGTPTGRLAASTLVDERIMEAVLGKMTDADTFAEKKKKLQKERPAFVPKAKP